MAEENKVEQNVDEQVVEETPKNKNEDMLDKLTSLICDINKQVDNLEAKINTLSNMKSLNQNQEENVDSTKTFLDWLNN